MRPLTVYIDIATSTMTLSEVMTEVYNLVRTHPEQDIFMDGDEYAIVGRDRDVEEARP